MILLHGASEAAVGWMRVLPDLVTTHRVVAPDLPGHGASEVGEGPLDSDRVLAWLGELIERTCPSPPILVGHGLGGAIAARLASDGGDRVGRLVLVDTFGLCPYEPAPAFGLALHLFLQQPTEATRDGVFRQCFLDLDGLRRQVGERWELLATYVLERARTPGRCGSRSPRPRAPATDGRCT